MVFIGHGRRDALRFLGANGSEQWVGPEMLGQLIKKLQPARPLHVLSLACETGYAAFAQSLSLLDECADCTAPFNDVHGAIASQFAQSLFLDLLLNGRTWYKSVEHARQSTIGSKGFRMWRGGSLIMGSS
jgi:hypothetical protein